MKGWEVISNEVAFSIPMSYWLHTGELAIFQTSQLSIEETISGRENTSPQNMYETYAAGALEIACIGLDSMFCIERYSHRVASGRPLPEATTGLGGSGLWNASVAAGKDFLENDNANFVLTKGTNGNEMHTLGMLYIWTRGSWN